MLKRSWQWHQFSLFFALTPPRVLRYAPRALLAGISVLPTSATNDTRSTRVQKILALRGPNVWARTTVLECWMEFPELSGTVPGWKESLRSWMPVLAAQLEEAGEPAPGLLATLTAQIALHLQSRADLLLSFSKVEPTSRAAVLRVVFQYDEEILARSALGLARRMLEAALFGEPLDISAEITQLNHLADDVCLGPSTRAMVNAAVVRGIPVRRLNEGSLVQLGWGVRQKKILAAATSQTSAIAEDIVQDKDLTRILLNQLGLPVPQGRPVESEENAWAAAQEIGLPVVVKPRDGNQGRGVALNLSTQAQVAAAYRAAREESSSVIVEQFAEGEDYRLLVVGRQFVAASRRQPAQVVGDGVQTVNELIAEVNRDPRRASDHAAALSKVRIDAVALGVLAEQGVTPESVIEKDRVIFIRRNANLSTGGTAADVTDKVHPTIRQAAIEAAQAVGLDICGIDLVAVDITQPISRRNGIFIELNARPGLRMHLYPSDGEPRDVGNSVINTMFAPGETGRIPIVAITGVNGKTTTTRLIAHLVRQTGKCVGMTGTDGVHVGDRILDKGDCSGPKSARNVLAYPLTEVAVLEVARGGIVREGLAFDHCDVAVVTNIGAGDHLGISEINTPEDLAKVKQCIVAAVPVTGTAVLNAADPLVVKMADTYQRRTTFFALDENNAVIRRHRESGGSVIFGRDGYVITAEGSAENVFINLAEVPLTHGGKISFQVENTLAAIAAARALGIEDEIIRHGVRSFTPSFEQSAARFNVIDLKGVTVVVDYGHNVDALRALLNALEHLPGNRRIVVYTSAGDRRDADIVEQGRMLSSKFDEAWLYEGDYVRGREPGEIMQLIERGLKELDGDSRVKRIECIHGHLKAVDLALASAKPGDLVMIQVDTAEETVQHIRQLQQS